MVCLALSLNFPPAVAFALDTIPEVSPDTGSRLTAECSRDGVAMGGFDLVSYFEAEKPSKGAAEFELEFEGVKLRFENAEHMRVFEVEPGKYLPRYGGWCATAVARNSLRCPDYDNYSIIDGQLLIFETTLLTNGRYVWMRDPDGNQRLADANFPLLEGGE